MVAEMCPSGRAIPPERDFRSAGCDQRCEAVKVLVPGRFGRSELLLHHPAPHEEWGRRLGTDEVAPTAQLVRTGPLVVDLLAGSATLAGREVHLTAIERRLLLMLAKRAGVLIWYDAIVATVWGASELEVPQGTWRHLIRVNVSRLRSKLGAAAGLVVVVIGVGMRLDVVTPCDTEPPEGYPVARSPMRRRSWAQGWAACRACGETFYAHQGRGLCSSCYATARADAARIAARLPGGRWTRDWEACRDCARVDRRHYGHGYCEACASRRKRRGER